MLGVESQWAPVAVRCMVRKSSLVKFFVLSSLSLLLLFFKFRSLVFVQLTIIRILPFRFYNFTVEPCFEDDHGTDIVIIFFRKIVNVLSRELLSSGLKSKFSHSCFFLLLL